MKREKKPITPLPITQIVAEKEAARKAKGGRPTKVTDEVKAIIRDKYPTSVTSDLAKELGLSVSYITKVAARMGVEKDPEFQKHMHAVSGARSGEARRQASAIRVASAHTGIHVPRMTESDRMAARQLQLRALDSMMRRGEVKPHRVDVIYFEEVWHDGTRVTERRLFTKRFLKVVI